MKAIRSFGRGAPAPTAAPAMLGLPSSVQTSLSSHVGPGLLYFGIAVGTLGVGAIGGYLGYRTSPDARAVGTTFGAAAGLVGGFYGSLAVARAAAQGGQGK
jgi:hypothetical protein